MSDENAQEWDRIPAADGWKVAWARGEGCGDIAQLLDDKAERVTGERKEHLVKRRANLLVSKKISAGFNLVDSASPLNIELEKVGGVTAVFGSTANALLAGKITDSLAKSLGVPGRMVCVYRADEDQADRLTTVERVYRHVPDLAYRVAQTTNVSELLAETNETDLLVIGSQSSSWLQRQMHRQESRLAAKAPMGSVVVRSAPARVFQAMSEPKYVSPYLGAGEAQRLYPDRMIAVVANGRLIGVVRRSSLVMAGDGVPVESCMEDVISVAVTDTMSEAEEICRTLDGMAVPVTDEKGHVVGMFGPATY